MVPLELILLTSERDGPMLAGFLATHANGVPVRPVATLADLERIRNRLGPHLRLLAFASGVIVPADMLRALAAPAYNIHPGPPWRPGTFPDVHAVYEGDKRFGATLHEMAPLVDTGAIVDVNPFDVRPGADRPWLAVEAMKAAAQLLVRWGPRLLRDTKPLPQTKKWYWSGRKSRMADFHDLCKITQHMPPDEIERRARSVLGGSLGTLRLEFGGRQFRLDPQPGEAELWPLS